jgi:curved DNA-binding protein CbpA
MSTLKDPQFHEACRVLNLTRQVPNDPDRKVIEKAFRKLALKTHPDKVSH